MQKQTIQAETEDPKKKSRFWIYTTIILLLVCILIYIIWLLLQRPVVSEIKVGSQIPENIEKSKEPKQYNGKYVSFSYPGNYQELTHTTPESRPVKESIFLSATDVEGQKIAVVVEERATGNLDESPSFQMRTIKPKEYKKEPISENDFKGFLFKKNTQVFEETAFVKKGNFIISVSLSSPMSIEGLHEALLDVLRGLEWKK